MAMHSIRMGLFTSMLLLGWADRGVAADLVCPSANMVREGADADSGYVFSAENDAGKWEGSDPMATSGYARDVLFSAVTINRGEVYCDYRDSHDKTNSKEFRLALSGGGNYAPVNVRNTWTTETSAGKTVMRCSGEGTNILACPFKKAE